jgi:hypothetical protein
MKIDSDCEMLCSVTRLKGLSALEHFVKILSYSLLSSKPMP